MLSIGGTGSVGTGGTGSVGTVGPLYNGHGVGMS